MDLDQFISTYEVVGGRVLLDVTLNDTNAENRSQFIVLRYKQFTMVLNPMCLHDHLCVDVHPFVDGADATVGAFGLSDGYRQELAPDTGTQSHGWPSTHMLAVIVGAQSERPPKPTKES